MTERASREDKGRDQGDASICPGLQDCQKITNRQVQEMEQILSWSPQKEPLPSTLIMDVGPRTMRQYTYCFSHPVHGILLWQSSKLLQSLSMNVFFVYVLKYIRLKYVGLKFGNLR